MMMAQSTERLPSPSPRANKLEFEVASIRPQKEGNETWIGVGGCLTPEPSAGPCHGRFDARAANVRMLVEYAYQVRKIRILGGPSWIGSYPDVETTEGYYLKPPAPFRWGVEDGRYDIEAKCDSNTSPEDIRSMLQNLLMDRFQLKIHTEMRDLPVFELVAAKNGAKLKEAADCGPSEDRCGVMTTAVSGGGMLKTARRVSMAKFAEYLAALPDWAGIGRPVLDNTGLTGFYDFSFEFATGPSSTAPSIFTALEQELGLKLESKREPVEMLVIDHVERPSEN
jgi:uncharacterized protein (TIGR03435 family)